jgi:phosphoribosylanthranilate isomerase
MTQVKICGITNSEDARVAVEAGVDWLGFIFYPPSPRYISPEHAQAIIARLPATVTPVGVFVNEGVPSITHVARRSGVRMVQLHGEESAGLCQQLAWPVIKTFRFTAQVQPVMMQQYAVAAFLIEGFHADLYGGGGARADWRRVAGLHTYGRIILAGGLTPENVREAIHTVRPYAVDVCSGVEAAPGKKDWQKVRAFIAEAKAPLHASYEPGL